MDGILEDDFHSLFCVRRSVSYNRAAFGDDWAFPRLVLPRPLPSYLTGKSLRDHWSIRYRNVRCLETEDGALSAIIG